MSHTGEEDYAFHEEWIWLGNEGKDKELAICGIWHQWVVWWSWGW